MDVVRSNCVRVTQQAASVHSKNMTTVLAMSGGVDSSAAAVLLQEAGHDVVGLFMRSGETADACALDDSPLPVLTPTHKQGCCSASDAADARRVADRLDIPFHALNFAGAFDRIKDYFADEYLAGRTPNPCVRCNHWIKFGHLWEFAESIGASAIATGHYARIDTVDGEPALLRGRDPNKDQSYVLFGIRRELLPRVLFPCGGYEKPAIRERAERAGLRVATKPDSQEICFVPDNDYAGFVARRREMPPTAGKLVDTAGTVVGEHEGYERFTIGQRRGLGVAFGEPRFVVRIEPSTREVVIGTKDELAAGGLEASEANWLTATPQRFRALAQIRYRHTPAACEVTREGDRISVTFDDPQHGVAPGQAVVIYDGDRVLGGAWID